MALSLSSLPGLQTVHATDADGCVNADTTQLLCIQGFVVTHYGCTLENEVHCAAVAGLPYAEKETSGGFAPIVNSKKVKIMRDGKVFLTEMTFPQNGTPTEKTTELNSLSAKKLGMLELAVKTNSGNALPPIDNQGGCVDAPSTYYRIVQDNGNVITIAAKVNCKDYNQADADSAFVKQLLDGAHM